MVTRYAPDQQRRAKLSLAGLGEKQISLFLYGDAEELNCELIDHYPKLAEGGGYELLRSSDKGGKELILLDVPAAGYSAGYLKSILSSAKIYIRPLQRDLDLTPIGDNVRHFHVNVFMLHHLLELGRELARMCNKLARNVGFCCP